MRWHKFIVLIGLQVVRQKKLEATHEKIDNILFFNKLLLTIDQGNFTLSVDHGRRI